MGDKNTHVLHDTNSLLGLCDKLILSLLNFLLGLRAELLLVVLAARGSSTKLPGGALDTGLDSIQSQPGLLDRLAGAGRKGDVGVQGGVPPSQEAALNLGVLGEAGLSNTLHGERILLERSSKRILTGGGVLLVESLGAGQRSAGDSMMEGLGLRLSRRRGGQGSLGFGGRGSARQQSNLLGDGATKVLEGLLDIRGVVVGLVGVLGAIQ